MIDFSFLFDKVVGATHNHLIYVIIVIMFNCVISQFMFLVDKLIFGNFINFMIGT